MLTRASSSADGTVGAAGATAGAAAGAAGAAVQVTTCTETITTYRDYICAIITLVFIDTCACTINAIVGQYFNATVYSSSANTNKDIQKQENSRFVALINDHHHHHHHLHHHTIKQ